MASEPRWYRSHLLWLELFVLANLAFLAPDIYLAHSTNSFRHWAEWIPFYFSLGAPVFLLVALACRQVCGCPGPWAVLGHLVGGLAVVVGVAGLIYHLESQFFQQRTLASLVYTAPFVAPLAYAGVGLLLIMNRTVDAASAEWPLWVLLLALGGFVGNFILSLADHAQNGFFHWEEWIPVVSSAFAVGFLLVPFLTRVGRGYLGLCVVVLLVQAAVGLLGFYYHVAANLEGPAPSLFDNFVWGAPALAPLLFPNLVLLAFIGLAVLRRHIPERALW
ncbi:MAG: hypothetical protein IT429_24000 [Gemmataceae bacterium]|nr:hypothetical protein [Gemmataceae bacterium]